MARLLRGYAFTIVGIAIGVAGLVALGAMAERIVRFIDGGDRFVLGQISVAGKGLGMGTGFTAGGLLSAAQLDAILMEEQGVPAIAVVTSPFRNTGEAMAASWGKPGYPFLDTPHPIANLTEADLDKRADELAEACERWLNAGA